MKCQSCNAHLKIDDERCPYCGTLNPEAVKHRQDMRRFSNIFHTTRSSVLKTTNETAEKSMRIVILCVMVVLLILSFLFVGFSWNIAGGIQKLHASKNSKELCAMLDTYEETGDYLSFTSLYEQKNLYRVDDFEQYQHVYQAASNYSFFFNYISILLDKESWDGTHERALKNLCESMNQHYEYLARDPYDWYYEAGAYDQRHLDAVDQITQKMERLLQLTFSMTEEELTQFRTYSSAEKQVFLERRFAEYE